MADIEQRWLTLDELRSTLRITAMHVRDLLRDGHLVALPGRKSDTRYLDPTPEYKEQLRIAAIIHGKTAPTSISDRALFTTSEMAELIGCKVERAHRITYIQKLPRVMINPQMGLYSANTIRKLIMRRTGRKKFAKRSPYLLMELIDWFRAKYEVDKEIPTDVQFLEDDKTQRRLQLLIDRDSKDSLAAQVDLGKKLALARQVVQILESATKKD